MNEPSTPTSSISRVAILVNNIDSSTKWYQSSFDCKLLWQTPTKALIKFENIELLLLLPSQGRPHLSFKRTDADTFGELFEQEDGSLSCSISDPAGNVIQLIKS